MQRQPDLPENIKTEMQRDPAQRDAICHGAGPALVLAGPGSGKTGVITGRIQNLIRNCQIAPENILVITFTRAAAAEMRQRSIAICPQSAQTVFGTFHSVFYQILRSFGEYQNFSILSTKERNDILYGILRMYLPYEKRVQAAETVSELMSYCKNACIPYEAILTDGGEEILSKTQVVSADAAALSLYCEVMEGYERECGARRKLDYDDILFFCAQQLEKNPRQRRAWAERFSYIMIDEFQDINEAQFQVVKLLAGETANVFAVGDDDQAIYGFRGADPMYMRQFRETFPGCRLFGLNVNYRSGVGIVRMSQKLIRCNAQRFAKQITAHHMWEGHFEIKETFSAGEELAWLAQMIRQQREGTAAVLCRTNRELEVFGAYLEKEMEDTGGAMTVLVKRRERPAEGEETAADLLAVLKMASGRRERGLFFRFMNKPERGISRTAVTDPVSFESLQRAYDKDTAMREVVARVERDILFMGKLDPYGALTYALNVMGYGKYVKSLKEPQKRTAERVIEAFLERARGYRVLSEFIEDMEDMEDGGWRGEDGRGGALGRGDTLAEMGGGRDGAREAAGKPAEEGESGSDKETGHLHLMTYHGAKGLEFDTVFLPGVNFGSVPRAGMTGKEALEEERRMFYVAMTRAKKNLYISYVRDAQVKDNISVFIRELRS